MSQQTLPQPILDGVVHPLAERAVLAVVLNTNTIVRESAFSAHLLVVGAVPLRESPLAGDDDKLTAGELELGTTESLDGGIDVL